MKVLDSFIPYTAPVRNFSAEQISREFLKDMQKRRSLRQFSDKPVAKEVIENAILTAGTAPNGAHMQPWHFVAISNSEIKKQVREAAEKEEKQNYSGRLPPSWLKALEPFGTNANKDYLEIAPWLIAVFARAYHWEKGEDYPENDEDQKVNHYYVQESTGIAVGMLLTSLHQAGLSSLTHTPSPMKFLKKLLNRPPQDMAYMLIPVGYPAENAKVPNLRRKNLGSISTFMD